MPITLNGLRPTLVAPYFRDDAGSMARPGAGATPVRTSDRDCPMSKRLATAGWMMAFVALCAIWTHEVRVASRSAPPSAGIWICPILGACGPAGTPGLG